MKFDIVQWVCLSQGAPKNLSTVLVSACGHTVVCLYSAKDNRFLRVDGQPDLPSNIVTAWANMPSF